MIIKLDWKGTPSPHSSPLNVSDDVALVHLSLRLFQSMIVHGINECLKMSELQLFSLDTEKESNFSCMSLSMSMVVHHIFRIFGSN
jgi:hypothetical protein